jgi:hypothetical protein
MKMLDERSKTAEELNVGLYEKVSAEFAEYKNNLLAMSPEQILEHAYDYAIREDIVLALEYFDLHARQAQALLKADSVLSAVVEKWEGWKNNYMESIQEAIECKANEISRAEYIKDVRARKACERDKR